MASPYRHIVRAAFSSPVTQRATPPQLSKYPVLVRDEAGRRLNLLAGHDLRPLAGLAE